MGAERGLDTIQGPLGLTDFDKEGMLVEDFDLMGTMSTIYNYSYYPVHMERLGFKKAAQCTGDERYAADLFFSDVHPTVTTRLIAPSNSLRPL